MNIDTGEVRNLQEVMKADPEQWVEVDKKDMTKKQEERFHKQEQPVVKQKDNKSKLAQLRNKVRKRRKKNKMSKYSRKGNR